jgi:hypothetical protein
MDVTELIDRYCQVWSEPDADRRADRLSEVWTPQSTYTDPTVHATGPGELLAHIAALKARRPGGRVLRTSRVDAHHGVARFAWHVVLPDGSSLPEGIDIAFIAPDGRALERIIGFFGPVPRDPVGGAAA